MSGSSLSPADQVSQHDHAGHSVHRISPDLYGEGTRSSAEDVGLGGASMAHNAPIIWPHFANMGLGLWLITTVFTAGLRSPGLAASDVTAGILVILFAALSLSSRPFWKLWAPWASSFLGLWLLFAPLVFWAPTAAGYSNDTLVGTLVIVFAVLAPGMPMAPGMRMDAGPDVPPGWSYNPSSWPQRAPIILLALVGFFLSRQMTAFQLGHVASLTDPFFGRGTERVLTSDVSRAFPIPDAGLGAVAYMVEFLMGFMGDKRRWRTMPWMVTFFGILVVPLGVVSITLIILQPLAVGAWCTPCLVAAAAMIVMIALTVDEVAAMIQFLVQARREGQSLWRTFWLGGTLRESTAIAAVRADAVSVKAMVWGVGLPWNLLLAAALGAWLMFSPSAFRTTGNAAHADHLIGALVVTASVIALADVARATRFINFAFGAIVIAAPWVFQGATGGSRWNDFVVGGLVILFSWRRGRVGERYGISERYIR